MNKSTHILSYYGWRVLAGGFVCGAMAVGLSHYLFGLFVVPVSAEFGLSRTAINSGMMAFMIGSGLISVIVGPWIDKYPAKWFVILGGISFGGALMLISRSHTPALMALYLGIGIGFGYTGAGVHCLNTVMVRWFAARRGRALGILAISASVGGMVTQPIAAYLIDTFGWRDALFMIGMFATILFVLMGTFVIKDRPKATDPGYDQEFIPTSNTSAPSSTEHLWSNSELLRSRNFWLLSCAVGLLFAADQAMLASQVPFFLDLGLSLSQAALLVTVKTGSAILGKVVVGFLADKTDLRYVYTYVAGSNMLLMAIYVTQPSFNVLVVSVALFGIAIGGVYPIWTTLLAWLFGTASYGRVMGLMAMFILLGGVASMAFTGLIYDYANSYVPAFSAFIGIVALSILLVSRLKKADQPAEPGTEHQLNVQKPA